MLNFLLIIFIQLFKYQIIMLSSYLFVIYAENFIITIINIVFIVVHISF